MTSDYMKDYNKQYYQNNKEYYYESAKKWRLSNPQKRKEQAARYYQRKKNKRNEKKLIPFNELAKTIQHAPIKGYETEYQAFENGKIWSWKYYMFKRQHLGKDGYYKVSLMVEGTRNTKDQMVSRLIASAFDNRPIEELDKMECHHLNMKQDQNNIQNLIFLTPEDHQLLHKNLTNQQIISIGQQVKHLRGSAKTNKFVELVGLFYKQRRRA